MAERPYSEDDLRREAASQHVTLTENSDFMGIGEQMQDREVTPGGGVNWDDFSEETFTAAQRSIADLLSKAADMSAYAIDCGAERLYAGEHRLVHGDEGDEVRGAFHVALDLHLELNPSAYDEIADIIRTNLTFRGDS